MTLLSRLSTDPIFSPEQAHWLREDEREYLRARLQADQGHSAAERKVGFRDVVTVMKDYKVWLGGLMYFGLIVPVGFSQTRRQLSTEEGIR